MTLTEIDEGVFAAPQIAPHEVPALARQGVAAIVCARPDGEEPGQPPFAAIEAAARAAGIETAHVPVAPSGPGPREVAAHAAALARLPRPLVVYCRSGARAAALHRAAGARAGG